MQLEEIVDIFELLGDWDQRYQYLIEMGERLPVMDDEFMTDENKVKGCVSQVWVTARVRDGKVSFLGDSDTSVIKGILALLINLCDGRKVSEIQNMDMDEVFRALNLDEHLSPNRHVGVYAMFDLMKEKARQAQQHLAA